MGLLEISGLFLISGLVATAGLLVLEGLEAMVRTVVAVARSRSVLLRVLGRVRVKVNDMRVWFGLISQSERMARQEEGAMMWLVCLPLQVLVFQLLATRIDDRAGRQAGRQATTRNGGEGDRGSGNGHGHATLADVRQFRG
jgi:hypothetical protein